MLTGLDVEEKAVQMLNMSPPQVTIRVKALEVPVTIQGLTGLNEAGTCTIIVTFWVPLPSSE